MSAHRIEADDLIAQRQFAHRIGFGSDRRVMTALAGERPSAFRGRGMDFEEHRVYQPGDEARTIDWRVTARTGRPHVRLYREERERHVLLALDLREPMWFGTRRCYKVVQAARGAALLAWAALEAGDRVGGMCFGRGHHDVRPLGGRRGVLRFVAMLCAAAGAAARTGTLVEALQRLHRTARSGGIVAVFSDFRGLGRTEGDLLRRLAQRTELIAAFVHDPLEAALPDPDLYPVAEREQRLTVDTRPRAYRQQWQEAFERRRRAVFDVLRGVRAHWLELSTAVPAQDALGAALGGRRAA